MFSFRSFFASVLALVSEQQKKSFFWGKLKINNSWLWHSRINKRVKSDGGKKPGKKKNSLKCTISHDYNAMQRSFRNSHNFKRVWKASKHSWKVLLDFSSLIPINIKWLALITKWVFMILWWCRMGLFRTHNTQHSTLVPHLRFLHIAESEN